jgi:hypothetical protein
MDTILHAAMNNFDETEQNRLMQRAHEKTVNEAL